MAQKILIRRGGIDNISSTIAVTKGELLYASGSTGGVENVVFVANATSNNTFTAVGQLYTGTASPTSFSARLDGLPYYKSDSEALYRLGNGTALDLSGNLEGTTVSSMTITTLTNTTLNGGTGVFSGNITGSNLLLSGDANINGSIVLGGNITIGDANTDNISLGGEFTSNLIPDADDTYALGSPTRRWNVYGVDSSITGSFSGSFSGNFDSNISLFTITGAGQGSGTDIINANDTLTFTNTSDHGFYFTITNNQIALATPQSLKTTASPTFTGVTAGNITVGVSTDNTITTSTGNLTISSTSGNTLIEGTTFNGNDVIIPGNLTVQGTTTQIDSTQVNIGDRIISLNAAGTAADGGIEVTDSVSTAGTGSLLWNSTSDYWYAGVSGSTHYRLATYANADPTTAAIPKIDSDKRLVASNLTDNATSVSSSADLSMEGNDITNIGSISITGLTANSFIHTNGSSTLTAVAPSTAGDLFQWNGTAFVASNVIDGGSF